MAYSTISKPGLHFNTKLYTGNGADATAYTGVGFQPDWTWIKKRNGTNYHVLTDAVRGATKQIYSNDTSAEQTVASGLQSFNADGFTLGTNADTNGSGGTYASWNWKASGSTASNTDGSITSTVSANTTAGFSIVSYTANATAGATVGHGLGAVPKMIIVKSRTSVDSWIVYHAGNTSAPETDYLSLNTSDATADDAIWNDTAPTSSVFSLGTNAPVNGSGKDLIAYCFAEKKGFSKFGTYTGNGSTDGPFVYTGFKPAFVIIKKYSDTANWMMYDNKREGYNVDNDHLKPNTNEAEGTSDDLDLLSNGFKLRTSGSGENSGNFIYMAIAEEPLVANVGASIPATAR
jgi:hypothetical protein